VVTSPGEGAAESALNAGEYRLPGVGGCGYVLDALGMDSCSASRKPGFIERRLLALPVGTFNDVAIVSSIEELRCGGASTNPPALSVGVVYEREFDLVEGWSEGAVARSCCWCKHQRG
jgi:hypothetical protein